MPFLLEVRDDVSTGKRRVQRQCIQLAVLLCLFDQFFHEVKRFRITRVRCLRNDEILIMVSVVDDQGPEVKSVDRSGLLLTLSSAVWRVEFLWIEWDDSDIQVAIHGPSEYPGTFRRVKYALVDGLELLLPLIGVAIVDWFRNVFSAGSWPLLVMMGLISDPPRQASNAISIRSVSACVVLGRS
ncbi:hypothetical protein BRC84_01845 [Halobacteriales archaeon QS_1_68_44]|nr:MAG: hypothetical protein BRC84_01845 [Halobacteriales archaeon QS_1_68_44]